MPAARGQQFPDSEPVITKTVNKYNFDDLLPYDLLPYKVTNLTYDAGTTDEHGRNVGAHASFTGPKATEYSEANWYDPGALFSYTPGSVTSFFAHENATDASKAMLGVIDSENAAQGNPRLSTGLGPSLSKHSAKLVNNLIDRGYFTEGQRHKRSNNNFDFEDKWVTTDCEDADCVLDLENPENSSHTSECGETYEVEGANTRVSGDINQARRDPNSIEMPADTMQKGMESVKEFVRQNPIRKPKPSGPRHSKGNNPDQMTIADIDPAPAAPRHKKP
jgi:hypothetical protein